MDMIVSSSGTAFKEVFKDSPQSLVRIVQVRVGGMYSFVVMKCVLMAIPFCWCLFVFSSLSLRGYLGLLCLIFPLQVIMVRLQRVTFMALQHYLGLTTELINPHVHVAVRCKR